MQVRRIQNDKTIFGTRVLMSAEAARHIHLRDMTENVIGQIKKLEQNGQNDILLLTTKKINHGIDFKAELTKMHEATDKNPPYKECLKNWYFDIENFEESYKQMHNTGKNNLFHRMEKLFPYII